MLRIVFAEILAHISSVAIYPSTSPVFFLIIKTLVLKKTIMNLGQAFTEYKFR